MPATPTPKQLTLIKAAIFVLALVPLARMVWQTLSHQFVEPLKSITQGTGDWTLYFLCLTLVVTPLRRLSHANWLVKLRRMLGLFAFFYVCLHFMTFVWFDHFFDLAAMWKDVLKRPFITVGFAAFVLLVPLAATSTNGMVRRLGARRWQMLHRAIYVIAPLGILHFWWMKAAKNNLGQPILFALIVALLLGMRLYWRLAGPQRAHSGGTGAASVPDKVASRR